MGEGCSCELVLVSDGLRTGATNPPPRDRPDRERYFFVSTLFFSWDTYLR